MKRILTILTLIFVAGIYSASAQCCSSNKQLADAITTKTSCDAVQANTDVKAYYFHATRRCATCEAVEKVTKETISENYKGKVSFESINREENKDNALVKKYKISGQTLLLIKGDEKVDLTSAAFMNARTNPEKFEAKLKSAIDAML
jgi:hypothetical protein